MNMEKNNLTQNETPVHQEEWITPEIKIFNVKEDTFGNPGSGSDFNAMSGPGPA